MVSANLETANPDATVEGTISPNAHIDKLPMELFAHILLLSIYMDYKHLVEDEDLQRLCLVSTQWRRTVLQCPLFWTCLDNFSHAPELVSIRLQRSKNASLHVMAFAPEESFLEQIYPHAHRIDHMQIRAEEEHLIRILNSPMPRLRILKVYSPMDRGGPIVVLNHSIDLTRLRRFKLIGITFLTGISGLGLGNLTALCLSDIITSSVSTADLVNIIRNSPNLDKVKLKYFHCQEDDAICTTASPPVNLPHLRYLYLLGVSHVMLDSVLANADTEGLEFLTLSDTIAEGPRRGKTIMQHLTRLFSNGESMLSTIFKGPWPKYSSPRIRIDLKTFPLAIAHDGNRERLEVSLFGNEWHPQLIPALSTLKDVPINISLTLNGGAVKIVNAGYNILSRLPSLTRLGLEGEWEELRPIIAYLSRHRETSGWTCHRLTRIDLLPRAQVNGEEIADLLGSRRFVGLTEGEEPLQIFGSGGKEFGWDRRSF